MLRSDKLFIEPIVEPSRPPLFASFNGGPVIYRPTPQENVMMLAQYAMRQQIRDEIEAEADSLWQMILKRETMRSLSVEAVEGACEWWFSEGYSEVVHWKAAQIEKAAE